MTDQSLLVNLLALHQSRAFSLHWSNDLLANLPKSWFCVNRCFKSVGIIIWCISLCPSVTNALECLQNQEFPCQTPYTVARYLDHDILAPVEMSLWHWRPNSLRSNMFPNIPAFWFCSTASFENDNEHIPEISLEIWRLFCKDSTDFLIESPFIRGVVYLDVPFISVFSFISLIVG